MDQRLVSCVFATIAVGLACAVSPAEAQAPCPGLLFANDYGGEPLAGSKQQLIDAVERGERIRVGWEIDFDDDGITDLAHWADAAFLSVWEGDVFTQVAAIHRQSPRRGQADIDLTGEGYTEWRGSLGTNGMIKGMLSTPGAEPGGRPVRISWCGATPVDTPIAGPTSAYLIVLGDVYDRDAFREHYAAHLPPLYEKYGGEYVAIGGGPEVLEGDYMPQSFVVAKWPSMEAARRFWTSPEYAELKKARIEGKWGTFVVLLVPGLPAAVTAAPILTE